MAATYNILNILRMILHRFSYKYKKIVLLCF